jgi:hypothetical protein
LSASDDVYHPKVILDQPAIRLSPVDARSRQTPVPSSALKLRSGDRSLANSFAIMLAVIGAALTFTIKAPTKAVP